MSFGKAQRFHPEKICGPPPTAYDPKLPGGGAGSAIFPKGDRFRELPQGTENNLTRSHSSSSVGSAESSISTKSHYGKGKDHTTCNKRITDLQRELQNMTLERNQLLGKKPLKSGTGTNKENEPEENINSEIQILNQRIEVLQAKLDKAKCLEDEKHHLQTERDSAISELEAKEQQVDELNKQIDELKAFFIKEEEELRNELEGAVKVAVTEKEELEAKISEYELKLQNLQNVRVELTTELEASREAHLSQLETEKLKHEQELEQISATHRQNVLDLENNLQQLAAEHDAESEQLKFEHSRQIEELQQNHLAKLAELNQQHSEQVEQIKVYHQEEISKLQSSYEKLDSDCSHIRLKYEEISLALETKLDEISTLSTQLEVAKEKLETSRILAEEKYEQVKKSLELDIAECRAQLEEERKESEEAIRSHFEGELGLVSQSNQQLNEMLQMRVSELDALKEKHFVSCAQYEEQIKRLNDNNQTEKEILMWQMSQQKENLELKLRTYFEELVEKKDAEYKRKIDEFETETGQLREDHANQIASIQANHAVEMTQERQQQELALEQLEKDKQKLLEERATMEKDLRDKEATIEKLNSELVEITNKLQLEIEMLREINNQLVADLLRAEQEKQLAEAQSETDQIEIRAKMEQEKSALIACYEEKMDLLKAEFVQKDSVIENVMTLMSESERLSAEKLAEKQSELDKVKQEYDTRIIALNQVHEEEVAMLHRNYERVLNNKDEKFAAEMQQLVDSQKQMIDELSISNELEAQKLQADLKTTVESLERQWMVERDELTAAHIKEKGELDRIFEEKLDKINAEHAKVVENLRKQLDYYSSETEDLQKKLEEAKIEFSEANEASDAKLTQITSEIENLTSNLHSKESEIVHLKEMIQKREKESADEWIQRETAIMAQVAAQTQQIHLEFESKITEVLNQLQAANQNAEKLRAERDAAQDDTAVFQVQMEAQLAALNEQYDQERTMLANKLSEQMKEIEEINTLKLKEANIQLTEVKRQLDENRTEHARQLEQLETKKEEDVLNAVRQALEPIDHELDELRKDREALMKLRAEYQELQARIEPFWEQLEMYEAEKKALLSQAQNAESSMASLASKYAQLLGHQNSKQKIHHLEKLKQDIFNLRKELAEKNLALEKEKKAKQKLEARLKEVTGSKKFDPTEAFKVPDTPGAPAPASAAPVQKPRARHSVAPQGSEKEGSQRRAAFRGQSAQSMGFFLAMDDIEKTKAEMERERRERLEQRRKASHNFDAFEVDFGNGSMRRETFDVPTKLNVTHCIPDGSNKENSVIFPIDLSGISISDEVAQKVKQNSPLNGDHFTSTPLQLRQQKL